MAFAALSFPYKTVENSIELAVLIACAIIEVVAFAHCLSQRADAFPVVGSLSKPAWLAILAGAALVTICTINPRIDSSGSSGFSIFSFIAIIAAGVYMLDVRPAIKDVTNGSGSW